METAIGSKIWTAARRGLNAVLSLALIGMGTGEFQTASLRAQETPVQAVTPLESNPDAPDPSSTPQEPPASEIDQSLPCPTVGEQVFDPCCAAAPAPSMFGGPWRTRPTLTGDWLGARPALAEDGILFDGNVTQFYQGVASGGREQEFRYGGHADYFMNIIGDKAGLGKGLIITLHAETEFGQSANGLAGTLLPVSLIQLFPSPTESVTALTGVKFTKVLSENWVTFAGKLNMFDDFKQPFASGRGVDAFMNAGFLFNPVLIRQVPYSTLGGGVAYLHEGQPVATLVVVDTNNTPTTSGFESFFNNGVTTIGQINIPTTFFDKPGHQGVGFSYSSGHYSSLDRTAFLNRLVTGVAGRETGSQSVFYAFDQTLMISSEDPTKSWGLFGNLGLADSNPSPINWFANIGIGGSSLICGRPLDTFGAGYYYTGVSNTFKNLAPVALPLRDEQGVEFFYNYAVTPWLRITPDLQVTVPALSRVDTAVTLGLRAKISF